MKKIILLIFVLFYSTNEIFADDYPKNHGIDILHYSFSLTLSDKSDILVGSTRVTVAFKKDALEQIQLDLVNKSEKYEGKGMLVKSAYLQEKELEFIHENDVIVIQFPEPVAKGKIIQLTLNYSGIPADGLFIGTTKYGKRSFFSNNWPNRVKHWLPVIDHPYEKATCEFKITAPSHYQVISNGLLMEKFNLDSGEKLTHWKQSVPISSWLYVIGVAEFAVQYVDEFRGLSIQSWVYPEDREAGFRDFAESTKQALRFFSEYIGPYAYEKFANVQSPSVGGGMETATAVFYNEDTITGNQTPGLQNVIIHEVAHHWFGNAVTQSTWDDVWLSEGFATFFSIFFRKHAFGREKFLGDLQRTKNRIFEFYEENPGYKIISDRSPETGSVTSLATYQKGGWVLHMLSNLVGDHAFKNGIRSYYNRYMNSNATTSDFKFEMEHASGKDLDQFFNQWLYQGGNPELKGSWSYDANQKTITVQLRQVQDEQFHFEIPIEIGIYGEGDYLPTIKKYFMDQRTMELTIPVDEKPGKVVIDPDTKLLAKWDFIEE